MIDSASQKPLNGPKTATESFYLGEVKIDTPSEEKELWWSFVQSPRFWVMLIGTVSVYLEAKGWLGVDERNLLASIAALFITVKTIDKLGKNMGA